VTQPDSRPIGAGQTHGHRRALRHTKRGTTKVLVTKTRTRGIPIYLGSYNQAALRILYPNASGSCYSRYGGIQGGPNFTKNITESIEYENSGWDHPNPCQHSSTLRQIASAEQMQSGKVAEWDYAITNTGTWNVDFHTNCYVSWMSNFSRQFGQLQIVGSPIDATSTITQKLAELEAGALKPIFNLPRAIIELKDVPQTLKGVCSIARALEKLGSGNIGVMRPGGFVRNDLNRAASMRKLTRNARNFIDASRGSLREVAGAYLTYQFGIRPTEKDVRQFIGLDWSRKQDGRSTKLWFESREIVYKKGEKLRCPFRLGPEDFAFPSIPSLSFHQSTTLLRDWTSPNGMIEYLNANIGAYAPVQASTVRGLAFGEVAYSKNVDIPYSSLMAYSGGFLSTLYEVTPWSFVVDWMFDVGKFIQNMEKMNLPIEYRPSLKFGSWLGIGRANTIYQPVFGSIQHDARLVTLCDPLTGYGGVVDEWASCSPPKWLACYESDLQYTRSQMSARDSIRLPALRVPGRYTLGPMAALVTQLFTKGSSTYRK